MFQGVGQIHWVEVVAFLVRLIYLALVLLVYGWKLDQVTVVEVKVVWRVVVEWTWLDAVIDDLRGGWNRRGSDRLRGTTQLTDGLIGSLCVVRNVLVDYCLGAGLFRQGLVLAVLRDELSRQLHNGVLDAGARQVLDAALCDGRRAIVETPVVVYDCTWAALILQAEGHRVVALVATLGCGTLDLREVALAHLTGALGKRGSSDQPGLCVAVRVLSHRP